MDWNNRGRGRIHTGFVSRQRGGRNVGSQGRGKEDYRVRYNNNHSNFSHSNNRMNQNHDQQRFVNNGSKNYSNFRPNQNSYIKGYNSNRYNMRYDASPYRQRRRFQSPLNQRARPRFFIHNKEIRGTIRSSFLETLQTRMTRKKIQDKIPANQRTWGENKRSIFEVEKKHLVGESERMRLDYNNNNNNNNNNSFRNYNHFGQGHAQGMGNSRNNPNYVGDTTRHQGNRSHPNFYPSHEEDRNIPRKYDQQMYYENVSNRNYHVQGYHGRRKIPKNIPNAMKSNSYQQHQEPDDSGYGVIPRSQHPSANQYNQGMPNYYPNVYNQMHPQQERVEGGQVLNQKNNQEQEQNISNMGDEGKNSEVALDQEGNVHMEMNMQPHGYPGYPHQFNINNNNYQGYHPHHQPYFNHPPYGTPVPWVHHSPSGVGGQDQPIGMDTNPESADSQSIQIQSEIPQDSQEDSPAINSSSSDNPSIVSNSHPLHQKKIREEEDGSSISGENRPQEYSVDTQYSQHPQHHYMNPQYYYHQPMNTGYYHQPYQFYNEDQHENLNENISQNLQRSNDESEESGISQEDSSIGNTSTPEKEVELKE